MKNILKALIGTFALFAIICTPAFAAEDGAKEKKIPKWYQEEIDASLKAIPELTDEQKVKVTAALEARFFTFREAKGLDDASAEAKRKEAWKNQKLALKETLSDAQIDAYDKFREAEAKTKKTAE